MDNPTIEFNKLVDNSLALLKKKKYLLSSQEFEKAISVLEKNGISDKDNICLMKGDLAYLMCLGKRYKEASEILKPIIQVFEDYKQFHGNVLEQAYCTYAICLYEIGEYIRSIFYYGKYLSLVKESKPNVYDYLKNSVQNQY